MDWSSWSTSSVGGAALIAGIGYAASMAAERFKERHNLRRERLARLTKLRSMLSVTATLFAVQQDHAGNLLKKFQDRGMTPSGKTWDELVSSMYKSGLTEEEKKLYSLIRSISFTMRDMNERLLSWVQSETYYRVSDGSKERNELARQLEHLDSHLVLWLAKYKNWIPEHPEHAIVYMADEERHGPGFPTGLDITVDQVLAIEGQTFGHMIAVAAIE